MIVSVVDGLKRRRGRREQRSWLQVRGPVGRCTCDRGDGSQRQQTLINPSRHWGKGIDGGGVVG